MYASTFYQSAKDYIKITSYSLEEEKMAVIIQRLAGAEHENRYYPDIAGVAKSYNFYPSAPQKSSDGIVSAALGLGKTVVDGGNAVRFCPKYPTDLIQFYSVEESLNSSQKEFFAFQLDARSDFEVETHDMLVKSAMGCPLRKRTELSDMSVRRIRRKAMSFLTASEGAGPRVVTFGPILHNRSFALAQILELLLDMGTWGMGTPVEIEFAVMLSGRTKTPTGICHPSDEAVGRPP